MTFKTPALYELTVTHAHVFCTAFWHHSRYEILHLAAVLIAFAAVCGGLVLLTYGADRFVEGAASTATLLGIRPLVVGLVIIGFATSAPEMLVSALASMGGNPDLGIGNAIGSNIANVGLVLGVTALVAPLRVRSAILKREIPVMGLIYVLLTVLMLDITFSRVDGAILIVALAGLLIITVWLALSAPADDPLLAEIDQETKPPESSTKAVMWLLFGLVLLLLGAKILVTGAVDIARHFGVSEVVIGLTVVAIGTSLPELAASVAGALKGEPEIALGNVIGSNMFNALGVMAMPALIAPGSFSAIVLHRDVSYMWFISLVMVVMAASLRRPGHITRFEGGVLLLGFAAYQALLFFTA